MVEFTHMMRNPIKERDDRITTRITTLEAGVAALKEREADLVRQNVALMGQNGRLQQEVERLTAERNTAMDRMQQAIIDLLNEHNAPLHLIARIVEMEYP